MASSTGEVTRTHFTEIIIEVVALPDPMRRHPLSALQPLNDLAENVPFFKRLISSRTWTRRTSGKTVTYRGKNVLVDTLDSLLLVLNQSRITSLRLHIHPYLPWVPIRVFETLLIPSLRILHFEQPLTAACIEPFAGFLQSATNLQSLRVSRISDQEAVSALIEGLLRANVPYVGYNFDRGSNVLDIDLAPLSPTSPTSLNFPTFPVEQKVNQRRSSATKYTARKRSTTSSLVHVTRY